MRLALALYRKNLAQRSGQLAEPDRVAIRCDRQGQLAKVAPIVAEQSEPGSPVLGQMPQDIRNGCRVRSVQMPEHIEGHGAVGITLGSSKIAHSFEPSLCKKRMVQPKLFTSR